MKANSRNKSTRKQPKASKSTKRQRIDLSGCKLVAPYGRDLHTSESLKAVVTMAGKVGFRKTL